MTSKAKIESNRRNAARSSGPRSAAGKARSRRNALRHGLAAAACPRSSDYSHQVGRLMRAIARGNSNPRVLECARIIAESVCQIERAKAAKLMLLDPFETPCPRSMATDDAVGKNDARPALMDVLTEMEKLDRYISRALSRRRRALCELHRIALYVDRRLVTRAAATVKKYTPTAAPAARAARNCNAAYRSAYDIAVEIIRKHIGDDE